MAAGVDIIMIPIHAIVFGVLLVHLRPRRVAHHLDQVGQVLHAPLHQLDVVLIIPGIAIPVPVSKTLPRAVCLPHMAVELIIPGTAHHAHASHPAALVAAGDQIVFHPLMDAA